MRFVARRLYYWPYDLYEGLSGQRDPMTPPRGMIFTGSGDFIAQGEKMLEYFQSIGKLEPHHHVLDVGCGIGRIAIPLTSYLDEDASYDGFDVVKRGVEWCNKHIHSRFPNFNFRYIDLNNDLYKASGASAANFTFPYPDDAFHFVVLTSVFTHMLPDEVHNYLREIRRVLKHGGSCFATFFLWNEETESLNNPAFTFPYDKGHYRLMDEQVQSANVAFQEADLMAFINEIGFEVESTHYGYWAGRPKETCKDFQDILILRKNKG
jgi:SAM-dependent methyltransferase